MAHDDPPIRAASANTMPRLGDLDILGRVPVPLRRAFAAGLDRTASEFQARSGVALKRYLLNGAEWYKPFDVLARAESSADVPDMLITTMQQDLLVPGLLEHYRPHTLAPDRERVPALIRDAGLIDPLGIFNTFAFVPFVWLVDERRLKARPMPRTWSDLFDPMWNGEIVFGGFRANEKSPYHEYNDFLLDCLQHEFGDDALRAFAGNVRHLQHNVRTATLAGSNSQAVGAIAVLPWLQAELSPRRDRVRVVWPEDGAWVMPITYLVQPSAAEHLQPVVDYLHGNELAAVLGRNCYPASGQGLALANLPAHARLKWPGWEFFRQPDLLVREQRTAAVFFEAWQIAAEQRSCG
jgi:ABC-type Fe3+ transport system substrate-binding protein